MAFIKSRCMRFCICIVGLMMIHCAAITEMRQASIAKGPEFTPFAGHKRRIAIIPFENLTENGGEKLGERVADMLTTPLTNSGRFIILERQEIDRILSEQAFGQSGAITEETSVRAGQLLGVEAIVLGDITEFDQKSGKEDIESEKKKWSLTLQATVANVNLNYRLVNTCTGEVLFSGHAHHTEVRPGFGIKTEEYDFSDLFQLDQTLLGTALRGAVNKAALDISDKSEVIPWRGKIIRVFDEYVYFTPGRNAQIMLNELFDVLEAENIEFEMNDSEVPETDAMKPEPKAIVRVVSFIGEKVSKALILQGGDIEIGDLIGER